MLRNKLTNMHGMGKESNIVKQATAGGRWCLKQHFLSYFQKLKKDKKAEGGIQKFNQPPFFFFFCGNKNLLPRPLFPPPR